MSSKEKELPSPSSDSKVGNNESSEAKQAQAMMESILLQFQHTADSILKKIDAMGNRIDDLETSIANLKKKEVE
jgi:hypothetical protein